MAPATGRATKKRPGALAPGLGLGLGDSLLSHGKLPHYHRRKAVSLPGSVWVRVGHARYGHQANRCTRQAKAHGHKAEGLPSAACRPLCLALSVAFFARAVHAGTRLALRACRVGAGYFACRPAPLARRLEICTLVSYVYFSVANFAGPASGLGLFAFRPWPCACLSQAHWAL
jgi:hypothetical protein